MENNNKIIKIKKILNIVDRLGGFPPSEAQKMTKGRSKNKREKKEQKNLKHYNKKYMKLSRRER